VGAVPYPRYSVRVKPGEALEVRYSSAVLSRIVLETKKLREMVLKEGVHFTINSLRNGVMYIYVRIGGLIRAAWLSVHGSGEQQKLAARFVEYILQRAWEAGEEVYEKAKEIIEEGKARGSLTLKNFTREVWMGKEKHVVKTFGCSVAVGESGLLHVAVLAEIGGVEGVRVFSFGKSGRSVLGFAAARANAPGGKEADAKRFVALVKALTGKRPKVVRSKRGKVTIMLYSTHLYRLIRYAELAEAIEVWLTETSAKR
jgi:hypothetical protein